MKKTFKKLFAVLLAAALVLAMAVPAFAADEPETGTITINNAAVGETYDIYQMFVLNDYSGENYVYTVSSAWAPFFDTNEAKNYIKLNNGHPIWVNKADDQDTAGEFAKVALAWAKDHVQPTRSEKAKSESLQFTGLDLGYYLVDTSLGSLCGLDTTAPSATINEKNEQPNMTKKVEEGDDFGETSHAKIGDTVSFKVTITVQPTTEGYVLRDTMSNGLTFDKNSVVVEDKNGKVAAANYTLDDTATDYTFTLSFKDTYISTLKAKDVITVTYNAVLNKDAVIDETGNTNTATLKYGNSSETVKHTTTTYSHQFDLIKVDGTTQELLAGAKFKLYDAPKDGKEIKLVKDGDHYRVATADETPVECIETVATAPIRITGLDNKVYYLEETEAPEGYNKLTARAPVDLAKGSNITDLTGTTYNAETVKGGVLVENKAGATLPGTGGMGTTLFYVIGGGLMIAAVVLLVTKKRMERKN